MAIKPAAPKIAATPTAPVLSGAAAFVVAALAEGPVALPLVLPDAEPLGAGAGVERAEVGVGTPLVKGATETLLAPLKPGAPAVAEALGTTVLLGLRTWSITWT